MIKQVALIVSVFAAIGLTGCSKGVPTYPVTGTVTNAQGDPIEGAAVTFVNEGRGDMLAIGVTDASGVYNLKNRGNDGAQEGEYKVTITKYESSSEDDSPGVEGPSSDPLDMVEEYPDDYDEAAASEAAARDVTANNLPARYANPNQSGLTATVSAEGENKFDFTVEK